MVRQSRFILPGYPQHVIQRGNNRHIIFADEADCCFYRDKLIEACERFSCRIHAYVLMTNHVHLLITPDIEAGIGKVMQSLGRSYVRYSNDCYRRTGTLWEGRYKAALLETALYLLTCYRYIELNPVCAGMVARQGDYGWSSYRATCQFWGGMRKVSGDRKQVIAQSMGWCNNPDSPDHQRLRADDYHMKKPGVWKKVDRSLIHPEQDK